MQDGVRRRSLLRHLFAAPFIGSPWKAGPPTAYLAELERLMRAASLPGAVIGCIQARKTAWIAPLGVQAANAPARIRPSTLFQAASLTKQVTAYAAFALRTQGKLDFDKPLVHYVDDLPNPAALTDLDGAPLFPGVAPGHVVVKMLAL